MNSCLHRNQRSLRVRSERRTWYKDAIIYQLHVKAFADTNNDGIGDFPGLTEKLDYLQGLGVTACGCCRLSVAAARRRLRHRRLRRINGLRHAWTISAIHAEANARGLRVITELVINHTSDQHPWFKRHSAAPPVPVRATGTSGATPTRNISKPGSSSPTRKSRTGHRTRKRPYYWHRFFSHQPDLNFDNPRVVSALVQVMKRWLDTGVDGFRLEPCRI